MTLAAVSIIIPSYMRTQVLWNSLEALRPQLQEGDEVLVIDQNHPPLQPPPALIGAWLRFCRLEKPSLTKARNLGLELASNAQVLFLDDDIIPNPDLLDRFKAAAREFPGWILTGTVDQEDKPADVPSPGKVDLRTGEIRTNFSRPISGETPFFPGGLVFIPKSSLPPPPWYCPAFKGAAQGEEIDFALRARARGVKIRSVPGARIYHLRVVEGGCRAPEFRRRFFLDHVFNQSLFFGRHGEKPFILRFLRRLKGFVEFHTRVPGGHDRAMVLRAGLETANGLARGIFSEK